MPIVGNLGGHYHAPMNATLLQPLAKRSTEDRALDALRAHVLSGGIAAGARVTEHGLSGALAISRATVRVALYRLATEGLIVQLPYVGWQVIDLTARDVWELYTLRAPLEALAARLAAEELDGRGRYRLQGAYDNLATACEGGSFPEIADCDFALHQLIIDHAAHARLQEQYRIVGQQVRLFVASSNSLAAAPGEIAAQHEPLVAALLAGDGESAVRLAEEHVLTEGRKLEAAARAREAPDPD